MVGNFNLLANVYTILASYWHLYTQDSFRMYMGRPALLANSVSKGEQSIYQYIHRDCCFIPWVFIDLFGLILHIAECA